VFGPSTYTNNPNLIEYWVDRWTKEPARSVFHQGMAWIDKRDVLLELAETDLPILVVQGVEEGAYLNEWIQPMLKRIPTIQSEIIAGAGHFVNIEQSALFNRAIRGFLDAL
jgi:pimeloyl-ACP methyl ester carboxylesterase